MLKSLTPLILILVSACTMAEEPQRSVSVSGTGSATAEADSALLQMGVSIRAKQLGDAQAQAARVTNALLAATDKLDIDRSSVDTTGAIVRPDYRWNRTTEEQELMGYIAERQIKVTVKDLDKLGELIESAVAAGVNQVSPPQLQSLKREQAYREALKLAALDARANAEVLATTLGAKLGDAIVVNAGGIATPQPRPEMMMAMSNRDSGAAASYNPGDLSFTASVSVSFALVD
jgi:uncharacterized protein YggE